MSDDLRVTNPDSNVKTQKILISFDKCKKRIFLKNSESSNFDLISFFYNLFVEILFFSVVVTKPRFERNVLTRTGLIKV